MMSHVETVFLLIFFTEQMNLVRGVYLTPHNKLTEGGKEGRGLLSTKAEGA